MPAVGMGAPTLSQIVGWDTEHLESAARSWTATAEHWEEAFTTVHRGSLNPGGTSWEGEGAEAAQQRTFADLVKVRGLSDHLYQAAGIARRGADHLDYLKRAALHAVENAREAGFNVGEDLSVSDRSRVPLGPAFAARQAQAQELAAEIGLRAAALSAADHEIAAEITAAAAPLSGVAFEEEPVSGLGETPAVQLVDYKKGPPTPLPGSPDDPANDAVRHPDYPDHRPDGTWAPDNSGVDGQAAADYTFGEMESRGIPLVRQEVSVKVVDPATGISYTRKYDALQPTGLPGQYIGIEHKVNASPITPNQRMVDGLVKSGVPARGTLNGQPIEVVKVNVIRIPWPPSTEAAAAAPGAALPAPTADAAPFPDWGTFIPPDEAARSSGEIGNLGKVLAPYVPRNPTDPRGTA